MTDKLRDLYDVVAKNEPNICEITVIKEGQIVYEEYWNGFHKGDTLNVMSVTKSVIALLIGIAIDHGLIKDVNQKVLEFFPDYKTKRGEKTIQEVTLRHLLTMSAPYKYRSEPWTKVCTSNDWTNAALDILGGKAGITGEFKYATLGIQILSGLLERVAGMKTVEFANKYLFQPLGIPKHDVHADISKEDQFAFFMNKIPRKNEWYCDPQGTATAGWGLTLSATDMASIGDMCLNNGIFHGQQVVSKEWIQKMTTPYRDLDDNFGNMSYGYLWWITNKEKGVYAAIGDGGNVIYVNPQKRIVVGVAGTFKPRIFDRVDFIEREILE